LTVCPAIISKGSISSVYYFCPMCVFACTLHLLCNHLEWPDLNQEDIHKPVRPCGRCNVIWRMNAKCSMGSVTVRIWVTAQFQISHW